MGTIPLVEPGPALTAAERRRYGRQLLLPELGDIGQRRLKAARVLVVGAGGLGSVTATYLAAAGVGTLGLVDDDVVEVSNLHRQVIHADADIGRPKVDSAAERIAAINPLVTVVRHAERLTAVNALSLFQAYDVVVDGSDNFSTRYLVADAAHLARRPHVWGSIHRFDGQVTVWWPPAGPCYRCVFPAPPPPGSVLSCAEAGVLGSLCAAVGSVQSTETIKLVTGMGAPLLGRILLHDALAQDWSTLAVSADPACALCGDRPTITEATDHGAGCVAGGPRLDPEALWRRLEARARGEAEFVLVDVREAVEHGADSIEGSVRIPLWSLASELTAPKDTPVILYCAAGVRSAQGAAVLREQGWGDVCDLDGGLIAWRAHTAPVQRTVH